MPIIEHLISMRSFTSKTTIKRSTLSFFIHFCPSININDNLGYRQEEPRYPIANKNIRPYYRQQVNPEFWGIGKQNKFQMTLTICYIVKCKKLFVYHTICQDASTYKKLRDKNLSKTPTFCSCNLPLLAYQIKRINHRNFLDLKSLYFT